MKRIKFGDVRLSKNAEDNLLTAVKNNWITSGPFVKEFEKKWGELFDYKYNIMVNSGTGADIVACKSLFDLNAKRSLNLSDNEIIAPALAFVAVGTAIVDAGFKPVFVDIKRETLNIDPDKIEDKITPKTRAILAVHTMGRPCEMDKIMEIARKHNLYVIEDSCEAHGAKYKGKFIGNWGDMATFSFYSAHLICSGEGGVVSTNNERIAYFLASIKNHGRKPNDIYFQHDRIGGNYKMNDMEAAIGVAAIQDFWETFRIRRENVNYLIEKTKDLQKYAYFNLEDAGNENCGHAFSVTLKDPKYNLSKLYSFLEQNGIECKRNFGSMPTQHKAFEFLGHKLGEFPESEYVGDNGLHFGIHRYLSRDDLDYASEKLHEYFNNI
ncbi:MAG: DegT/DnrJ/EryC1/StrS family aminotransferase [Nanoarchaeota archaeon]|nr:DegT/DnrJ/EryC1/StrS family aminotransferase [Nanoarchaeota archaeon]